LTTRFKGRWFEDLSCTFEASGAMPPLQMRIRGLSVFRVGVIVAVVHARIQSNLDRVMDLREALYMNGNLRDSYDVHPHKQYLRESGNFVLHISLLYVESMLTVPEKTLLADVLVALNARYFADREQRPLFAVEQAELRKFEDMGSYCRNGGWLVHLF
jgi:hypothetical protein